MEIPDMLSRTQLDELIGRENEDVELKTGAGVGPLQESMVAFSNTPGGGTILIGIADDRQLVGRRLDQGTDDRIRDATRTAHSIGRYTVREVAVDGIPLVVVRVRQRQEGYAQTSNGRVLIREGGHNVHPYGDDLWQLLSSRRFGRFERVESGLDFDAMDAEALASVASAFGWDPNDGHLHIRLRERGLAHDDGLTVAGALVLTDPNESLSLQKAQVEIRRYPNDGPDYDRRVFIDGPVTRQVTEATRFIVDELGTDLVVTGVHRYDLPKVPEVVVREAVANAVAHRSYEHDRVNVLVQMRSSKLIIRSPGALPEPVTVDTMRSAQAARNPTIIDVLRRLRLAEDAGRGVDVMEDSMAEALLNPPEFEEDGESVVVTLPLLSPITPRERAWVADLESRGDLRAVDRMLLIHAARGERLTNALVRDLLDTDALAARGALRRLRDQGFLIQEGERGGSSYTITESLAPAARFRLSEREMEALVLEAGRSEAGVANSGVRELTGLNRDEALNLLRRLVAAGQMSVAGQRRGTRYFST